MSAGCERLASVDLAVVGAGALGLTTAFEVSRRRPGWSVLILEREAPLAGASGSSASVAVSYGVEAAHRRLAAESVARFRDGELAAFAAPPPALVVAPRAELAALQERVIGASLPTADRAPALLLESLLGSTLGRDEVLLDAGGTVFVFDLAALARDLLGEGHPGVGCWSGAEVVAIARRGRGYRLETAAGGAVEARRVVIATGPWPAPPVEGVASRAPLPVQRLAALHLARPPAAPDPLPIVFWPQLDCFLLPERHQLLFSFPRQRRLAGGEDPAAELDRYDLERGLSLLRRLSPQLAAAVLGGRAHGDSYAERRLPRLESDPAAPGLLWLRGGSGSGAGLAPALAGQAFGRLTEAEPSEVRLAVA